MPQSQTKQQPGPPPALQQQNKKPQNKKLKTIGLLSVS
jgi:hypothetical protein